MPQIHSYPSHELPDWIKYQVLSFIRIEWWWIFQRDPYWNYLTEKSNQPVNFVMTERDTVISHAEVNCRVLKHQGQTFKTFGVSAVFTYPIFRRQGYASQIMQAAVDYIDSSDADIAILFCLPPLRNFYVRCGWTVMDNDLSQNTAKRCALLLKMRSCILDVSAGETPAKE
jgi:GNAT superfamily N-acetyltransferase